MRDVVFRVSLLEHNHLDRVVCFQFLGQVVEVRKHRQTLDVDRRIVECDPCDSAFDLDAKGGEFVVGRCASPADGRSGEAEQDSVSENVKK